MRWRCKASFPLRMRLAALIHSSTCCTRSRGAMTARWKGYSATDTARRTGSSTRSWESTINRASARMTSTASRTSAGGPRRNSGGVACRCMDNQPGPACLQLLPSRAGLLRAGRRAARQAQSLMKMAPSFSRCSSASPQPRTTQVKGSSATTTGRPVSSCSKRSRSRSSAPPPVRAMPLSVMSALQLGRRLFERDLDGRDDLVERIGKRFGGSRWTRP